MAVDASNPLSGFFKPENYALKTRQPKKTRLEFDVTDELVVCMCMVTPAGHVSTPAP